jgi:di/tricarboxylate transporter
MQSTGTAAWLANGLVQAFGGWPSWTVLTILAILASLFSLIMSNVGATVVLVPIGIHLAYAINADPRLFALVIALASSNSFLIPTHQVNTLISGPGGYATRAFLKVGAWVSVLYLLVMLPAAYLFLS